MHKSIDFSFHDEEHKFVTISKFGARWSNEASDHKICFNKQKMTDAVLYLLPNSLFTIGLKIFGIPMVSYPARFFTNMKVNGLKK